MYRYAISDCRSLRCLLTAYLPLISPYMHLQAMHQSVQQWWNMPEGNPWSYAPVLHTFQACKAFEAGLPCVLACS